MADRLSALDASFLYLEERSAPLHVGSVAVFRRPRTGFDYGQLVSLIERRLPQVPRYRQKVVPVPGHLARPVWADDPDFDLTYHVRRSALPRPGTEAQLLDLVARLMSRPLDHDRPLWEAYLVEGLARSHAVGENARRPREVIENARSAAADAMSTARKVAGAVSGLISAFGDVARPATAGPLNVPIGSQRRYAVARARLEDLRSLHTEHESTVNDVVLAVVAGALRNWLLSRGEPVTSTSTLRVLVPIATQGNTVTPYLVELPVGEPNPVVRLQHISHAMRTHTDSVRSVAATALLRVGDFSPPTLHSLGARAAAGFSKRIFNLVITNVPGPQVPLYAGTAQLTERFPAMPLVRNQALAVGVTSYDGGVYFGLTGDWDAAVGVGPVRGPDITQSDVDLVAKMLEESVDELLSTPRRL